MKLSCLFLSLIFAGGLYAQTPDTISQNNTPPTYEQMRKGGTGLIIGGSLGMVAGVGLLIAAGSKSLANGLGNAIGVESESGNGTGEAVFGTLLFAGGVTALIVGITKSSRARRMREAGIVGFQPYTSPVRVTQKVNIPQSGFTISIRLGK